MNISVCGIDCDACNFKEENKCEGCRISAAKGQCVWNGRCDLHDCCTGKAKEHCGQCESFPCQKLTDALNAEGQLHGIDNLKELMKNS